MAETAIQRGDLVAGLARLRLAIELRLREMALDAGLPGDRASGGRLISMLHNAHLLDPDSAQALNYAVRIGNQGVHGEDIGADQAAEALALAQRVLDALGPPGTAPSSSI
jgi:hypothetical protein